MLVNEIGNRFFAAALIGFGLFLTLSASASAADLFVSTTGSDTSNCQTSSSPCLTIQHAVNQAVSGDTVELASGTYTGAGNTGVRIDRDIDLNFKGVGATLTTIDGADSANLFSFDTDSTSEINATFQDLALKNGSSASIGAAIQEEYWVTLSLELTRVLVEGNTSGGDGGAIRARKGHVEVHDSTFRENQAFTGGAIKARSVVISSLEPDATAPTSLFAGNSATGAEGGAISSSQVLASDVAFEDNAASGDGGAINIGLEWPQEPTAIQLTRAVFRDNEAFTGGAFRVSTGGAVAITESVFDSNAAANTGGVMRVDSPGQVTVVRSTMTGNTAINSYAVADMFPRDLSFVDSTINANQTTGTSSSFAIGAARDLTFTNSTITGNSVGPSGYSLAYTSDGDIRLRSTTSSANAVNSSHFFSSGRLDVANSIINESGSFVCGGISPGNLVNGGGNVLTTTVSSDCDGLVGTPLAPTSGAPPEKVSPASLLLGSLADNGGLTKTLALGLGSSALRTSGSPTACPAEDQRGEERTPTDCDAGAFELPSHPFFITKSGTGSGTVTGTPAPPVGTPIDCGSACSGSFDEGTIVELTASAASGSTFTGWSGACSGTASSCSVTLDQARSVTAAFDVNPTPPEPDPPGPGPDPAPTGQPKLRVSVSTPKKVRAGKDFPVEVEVSNVAQTVLSNSTRSATTASSVKSCARLPKGLYVLERDGGKVKGRTVCWVRSSLEAGESVTYRATARSSMRKSGSMKVSGTVSASNSAGATVQASGSSRVRVIEPKKPKPTPPTG